MERLLARGIQQIADDDRGGAAELALDAVDALQKWLAAQKHVTSAAILEAANAIAKAHPEMAPLGRIAAEVSATSRSAKNPAAKLSRILNLLHDHITTAPQTISEKFARLLPRKKIHIAAYSYSSTVANAIIHARKSIGLAYISEGRPGNEGRTTATKLARAGIRVIIVPDVVLLSQLPPVSHVVFGADCIMQNGFFNKTGTSLLMRTGLAHGAKVWVLSDTLKFWPYALPFHPALGDVKPNWRFWDNPPSGVLLKDQVHELVPFLPGIQILTERGMMTPAKVREMLSRLRKSTPVPQKS
jgi:translation initiation factor 2B subunit (eIF-2B alpha/beta/delta family)